MNTLGSLFNATERADNLTSRANQAKAVLSLLSMAIEDDCPPTNETIVDILSAVEAILAD